MFRSVWTKDRDSRRLPSVISPQHIVEPMSNLTADSCSDAAKGLKDFSIIPLLAAAVSGGLGGRTPGSRYRFTRKDRNEIHAFFSSSGKIFARNLVAGLENFMHRDGVP